MTQAFSPISEPPYFQGLNPPQRQAVETLDGPVLVLAGAGTGKTRVLTTRLAHLLQTGRAFPGQILSVTFTNKAAHEMKERIARLLGRPVEGMWLGTFHALAARMLRRHADVVGLTSSFTILDPDDQVRLIKQLMELEGIDTKKWAPKAMASVIDRWKDRAMRPDDVTMADAGDLAGGKMPAIYRAYQDRLKIINACDFGDLLLHVITILRNPAHRDILADYHRRFRFVMVDEYQDTNVAQYLWLRLLADPQIGGSGNICCVGDDDQSIYGWRGAEVGNILRFEKDFPGASVIRLEQNYRSTGAILAAAAAVIANNKGRLGKTLWSAGDTGDKVFVRGLWDGEAEARFVGEEIESRQRAGIKLRQMAVLVRAGFQMREFEERFISLAIPYRVFGGPRFYERAEVRDALAYFRVVVQPSDDLAFERIINLPKRGIGDATIQLLHTHARARGTSLYNATAEMCLGDDLKPKVRGALARLMQDFTRWRDAVPTTPHAVLAGQILDESGYTAMWQADKSLEAPGRLENLKELVSGMEEFESLPAFLEHVSLVMENQNAAGGDDYVSLMTLHGAKGLEFDVVFLPGWEEGLFPSQRSMDENGMAGLEEERRLAYVGITRARKRAVITHVGNRRMYGSWVNAIPSRFVDELPAEHIEIEAETGLYGGNTGYGGGAYPSVPSNRFNPGGRLFPVSSTGGRTRDVASSYRNGDRVTHAAFGPGTVIHVDGHKLDIQFDDGSTKRVMDSFVEAV